MDIVTLNVGGKKFQTTRHTLAAKEDSFLAKVGLEKLQKWNVQLEKHNIDGEVFIDRDPVVFHLILNFLRDGRVVFPDDGLTAALLFQEAKVLPIFAVNSQF